MNLTGSDKVVLKNNINGSRFVVSFNRGPQLQVRRGAGRRERERERWNSVQEIEGKNAEKTCRTERNDKEGKERRMWR